MSSVNADSLDKIKEVMLSEQLFDKLPVGLKTYCADLKLDSVQEIALALDNYTTLHKTIAANDPSVSVNSNFKFDNKNPTHQNQTVSNPGPRRSKSQEDFGTSRPKNLMTCANCHKTGRTTMNCSSGPMRANWLEWISPPRVVSASAISARFRSGPSV